MDELTERYSGPAAGCGLLGIIVCIVLALLYFPGLAREAHLVPAARPAPPTPPAAMYWTDAASGRACYWTQATGIQCRRP